MADDVLLRSARNAFIALLLVLVGVSIYQFATVQRVTPEIAVVWVTGASAFYGSKWYYGRNGADGAAEGADAADGEVDAADVTDGEADASEAGDGN